MVNLFTTKEPKVYNGEKTVSSINGAGKTGQSNENGSPSHTIHKN